MLANALAFALFSVVIAAFTVARFYGLEIAPPGFFSDEQTCAANILCLVRDGVSAYGVPWATHPQGNGGTCDPLYTYIAFVVTQIFGTDVGVFRMIPTVFGFVGCIGVFFMLRARGTLSLAILGFLCTLMSPWAFQLSRVAWGSAMVAPLIALGLAGYLWGIRKREEYAKHSWILFAMGGLCFGLAMIVYNAGRFAAPVITLFLFAGIHPILRSTWKEKIIFSSTMIIGAIPDILFMMSPLGMARAGSVGLWSEQFFIAKLGGSWLDLVLTFFNNVRMHFMPKFLFLEGDFNYRHTPAWPATGWLEWAGFVGLALMTLFHYASPWKMRLQGVAVKAYVGLFFFCMVVSVMPSALTWDSPPHGLRSHVLWVFFGAFAALGLEWFWQAAKIFRPIIGAIAVAFALTFLPHYYGKFTVDARWWYDADQVDAARYGARTGDWLPFGKEASNFGMDGPRFWPMALEGKNCADGLERLKEVRNLATQPKPVPAP